MATRTPKQIQSELDAARQARHEATPTATQAELSTMANGIKALMAELTAAITDGAQDCPGCGRHPHGIRQMRYYEIGCLNGCQFEGADGKSFIRRSQGETPADAVAAWNNGEYFEK